jgi:hypothetical protein
VLHHGDDGAHVLSSICRRIFRGGSRDVNTRRHHMRGAGIFVLVLALGSAALAAADTTPYAGLETRTIKALSDEQIADLRAGRGMGLALAAELNAYPGPAHVLELADRLDLSAEQRARSESLFADMKRQAIAIGETILRGEAELDRSFAEHSATAETLRARLADLAIRQGELRYTHLRYHLAMVDLLTPEQIERYRPLRGYTEMPSLATGDHGGHRH